MAKAAGVVPVTLNIKIPQGATFIERFFFLTEDDQPMPYLETATVLCQVRAYPADVSAQVVANANVTVSPTTGEIEVFYPVTETVKLIEPPDGCGYYRDIRIIYDDNSEDCIVTGRVMPIPEVSRV
uniref:hypothetical protein n=1 Tax=Aerococcus urinaeequi TaxID=51665 RepID=UPI00352AF945